MRLNVAEFHLIRDHIEDLEDEFNELTDKILLMEEAVAEPVTQDGYDKAEVDPVEYVKLKARRMGLAHELKALREASVQVARV